jgi:8-oxo-dGTP pyrophosphatase MutT (NUDIX family)
MFTKTFVHKSNVPLKGLTYDRKAVRAVILRGGKLLMVYSTHVGDYKFPGGGIKINETHAQALEREVLEETGAVVTGIGELIGEVTELDKAIEPRYELFRMISYYYTVSIADGLEPQRLDEYEKELGFTPIWVEIDEAIRVNTDILNNPDLKTPGWTRRELYALQEIKQSFLH